MHAQDHPGAGGLISPDAAQENDVPDVALAHCLYNGFADTALLCVVVGFLWIVGQQRVHRGRAAESASEKRDIGSLARERFSAGVPELGELARGSPEGANRLAGREK